MGYVMMWERNELGSKQITQNCTYINIMHDFCNVLEQPA